MRNPHTSIPSRVLIVGVILIVLFVVGVVCAEVKGNVKYEVTDERIVISCVDGQDPIIRTTPRPKGGYYAVVVCERTN